MSRLFLALFLFLLIREKYGYTNITLTVNYEKILAEVRKEFLSVSLDTHLIQLNWGGLNFENQRVQRYARNLAPAILRVGGTSADSLYFKPAFGKELASKNILPCYDPCNCDMDYKTVETFNMTARQWHQLANFAQRVGWTLLFDLNVLDRHNGSWTGKNAELLFDYASRKSVGPVYWQLGNEPNILPHFYNRSINPSTLGRDFLKLSTIVKKYKAFQQSLIVGPDVTHPKQDMNSSKPMKYLRAFLQAGGEALDAVSWHHYYFDGRQATADDFVNITHFDSFKEQAKLVCSETRRILGQKKSVWLTETSDGYGGGVRNLSQTFIANFLWLDKLGVSAQQGIELIVRQSFYHGCYGLLNPNLEPTPVYWLSVLHKRLVGTQVFNVSHNGGSKIRFYSHCGNRKSSLVVFGMNLNNFSVGVNFGKELAKVKFRVFIWTEDLVIKGFKDIQNKFVKDISFEMPPKSIAFVKFRKLVGVQACK